MELFVFFVNILNNSIHMGSIITVSIDVNDLFFPIILIYYNN